jgi:hypothetical protein
MYRRRGYLKPAEILGTTDSVPLAIAHKECVEITPIPELQTGLARRDACAWEKGVF